MNLPLRARAFGALLGRSPAFTIVGKTASEIPALRSRLALPTRGSATLFTGRIPGSVVVDWIEADLPGRRLAVRRYRPLRRATGSRPVLVDFHGGAFVFGNAAIKDWFNGELAARLGVVVVSVNYRLAPEKPFPAAYEDAVDATNWAAKTAQEWGGDPARIVVVGDSAGGNLAAGAALASGVPLAAQVLLYPVLDLLGQYPSAVENAHAIMLTAEETQAFPPHYVGDHDRSDPRISPMFAPDHRGLPSAVIIAAEHDPIRDQSVAYAAVLRAAGVPVRQTTYPGAAHGFLSVPGLYPAAIHALTEVADALRQLLSHEAGGEGEGNAR
ncbi:MAG TPA: alpha/beta hydrolase [Pseudonocardiaceae bacterium]